MESTLQLEIVTPDKVVVSQTVDYVGVPFHSRHKGCFQKCCIEMIPFFPRP